jgi:hypothetical protein
MTGSRGGLLALSASLGFIGLALFLGSSVLQLFVSL